MKLLQLTIIVLLTLIACKQTTGDNQNQTGHHQLYDYPNTYKTLLVTAKELVKDSFYKARNFENYESLDIDSGSSSILYLKYRFKVKDAKTNFNLTIGTLIAI